MSSQQTFDAASIRPGWEPGTEPDRAEKADKATNALVATISMRFMTQFSLAGT